MVTSIKQTDFKQTALRISPDMHSKLHQAASLNGRSYNAEIVNRLKTSFDPNASSQPLPPPAPLPEQVQQAVNDEMAKRGGTPDEALTRLVLAGQAEGGVLFNLRVGPGTSAKKLHEILNVALRLIPADAKTVVNLDATQP